MPNNPTPNEALERYLAGEITYHEYLDIEALWDTVEDAQ